LFAWPPYSDIIEVGVLNGFFRKGAEFFRVCLESGNLVPLSCRHFGNNGRACRFCASFCRLPSIRGNKRQVIRNLKGTCPPLVCRNSADTGKKRHIFVHREHWFGDPKYFLLFISHL
jgi:hypothetical protein